MSQFFAKKSSAPKKEETRRSSTVVVEKNNPPTLQYGDCANCDKKFEVSQLKTYKKKTYCPDCLTEIKETENQKREDEKRRQQEVDKQNAVPPFDTESFKKELQGILADQLKSQMTLFENKIQDQLDDGLTSIKKDQQSIVPTGLDTQLKQLNIEQEKLKAQLQLADNKAQIQLIEKFDLIFKEISKPRNSELAYYDRKTTQIFIRRRFPQLEKYGDDQLNTEEKIKSLPFFKDLTYNDQQIILFMATCIRRAGMIELHNLILNEMNAEGFKP